jgi:GNAT superfamily N-acetyltransferase
MKITAVSPVPSAADFTVRSDFKPGDLGRIIHLHGILSAREFGLDLTFEADVAGQLAEFARSRGDGDWVWIAERDGNFVGFMAVVSLSPRDAQLRWFLIDPSTRGVGLEEWLFAEAIAFCERCGYECLFYGALNGGKESDRLYQTYGFAKVQEHSRQRWGTVVNETLYRLHPKRRGACDSCCSFPVPDPHRTH